MDAYGKFVMTLAFSALALLKLLAADMYLIELESPKLIKYLFILIMFAGWGSYALLSGMMLSNLLAAYNGNDFVKYFGFSVPIFLNLLNLFCMISIV